MTISRYKFVLALNLIVLASCGDQPSQQIPDSITGVKAEAKQGASQPDPFANISLAGTTKPTQAFDKCMNSGEAAQGITIGMMDCLGTEIDRQDDRINATYKVVMSRLTSSNRIELRQLQRDWIKDRDTQCEDSTAEYEGGTLAGVAYNQCIIEKTIDRSLWLVKYQSRGSIQSSTVPSKVVTWGCNGWFNSVDFSDESGDGSGVEAKFTKGRLLAFNSWEGGVFEGTADNLKNGSNEVTANISFDEYPGQVSKVTFRCSNGKLKLVSGNFGAGPLRKGKV